MDNDNCGCWTVALIILAIICLVIAPIVHLTSKQVVTFEVAEKWVDPASDGNCYLVADPDGNVYTIADDWFFFRFDASDRWVRIQQGHTYRFTIYGFRIRFISGYPNIEGIEEIHDSQTAQ